MSRPERPKGAGAPKASAASAAEPPPFEVACPGCQARLTVDPVTRAVLAHVPAPRPATAESLDAAVGSLRGEQARREARFQEAAQAERSRKDVLARKFAAGLDRARETPAPPRRLFDGD